MRALNEKNINFFYSLIIIFDYNYKFLNKIFLLSKKIKAEKKFIVKKFIFLNIDLELTLNQKRNCMHCEKKMGKKFFTQLKFIGAKYFFKNFTFRILIYCYNT
jgi:hypothetical protein